MKLLKRLVSVFAIVLAVGSNAFAGDEVRIVIDEGVDGARPYCCRAICWFCTRRY